MTSIILVLNGFSWCYPKMQLLNPPLRQLPADSTDQLLDTFQNIANNVQIESEFCISHPDYKPLEFSRQVVERFKQMPLDIQDKYLSLQLRSFLYGIYYNGSLRAVLASGGTSPHQYVIQQRVERAKEMLLKTDLAITLRDSFAYRRDCLTSGLLQPQSLDATVQANYRNDSKADSLTE
ncbi:MAG TPA: hypothetical protein V6C85_16180 [Allocoleopsis sp.]